MQTQTQIEQDRLVEQKIQKVKELYADAMGLTEVDILGFSLGGMVAQEIALERPSLVRRMLLVATAPEGG